jgi:hypothetical protein
MAYVGTTAASSVANPPILLARGMGQVTSTSGNLLYSTAATSQSTSSAGFPAVTGGTGLWYYASSDPSTTIVGTLSYFTDGLQLGMRNGDLIFMLAPSSGGSTGTVLLGIAALMSTNSTAGFGVVTGTQILSTQ